MIGQCEVRPGLEAFGLAEGADDGGGVLMLRVDGVVEAADVSGGEFAGEIGEGGAKLGESGEGGLADDGDGVVGREIVAVGFWGGEGGGNGEGGGGGGRGQVGLALNQGAGGEGERHHSWRVRGEENLYA